MDIHTESFVCVAPAPADLVQEWVAWLRRMDVLPDRWAAERGTAHVPLTDAECTAAGQLVAGLGVSPAAALARLPTWCVLRPFVMGAYLHLERSQSQPPARPLAGRAQTRTAARTARSPM